MRLLRDDYCSYFSQPAALAASFGLVVAGLDINSTHIKSALIRLGMNDLKIIGQADVLLPRATHLNDLDTNLSVFQSGCQQALKLVQQGLEVDLQSLVIGLSGDLVKGITKTTVIQRPNPRLPLSEKEVDNLLLANQMASLKQATKDLQLEYQDHNFDLQLLNSSLVRLAVDGQPVVNPLNYQATTVSIQLYNVFIPAAWLQAGQKIAERLGLNLIALAYKPFALSRGLLSNPSNANLNALIINIQDHITDLGLIQNGTLTHSANFSLGEQAFHRALARHLDKDESEIANLKNPAGNFDFSQLDKSKQAEAHRILSHTVSVWLQGLILLLKDFGGESLPAQIYLSGDGAHLEIVRTSLHKLVLSKTLVFQAKIEVEVLSLAHMAATGSESDNDNGLSLATLAGLGKLASDILNIIQNMPEKSRFNLLKPSINKRQI